MPEYVNGPTVLRNRTCAYCGCTLTDITATKEHVIGRRFVPKGTLANSWNLIVRVCVACNSKKSDLENDISAISMQPDVAGRFHDPSDHELRKEATRKGKKSVSRRTGKPVGLSQETITFRDELGPMQIEFTSVGPPQVDEDRAVGLALLHITGFMYWLTYEEDQEIGHFIPGVFLPLGMAMRGDWGNLVHRAFMQEVVRWDHRLVGHTAGGYFKVAIRKRGDSPCWSWALEWNCNLRLIGFFGNEDSVRSLAAELPRPEFQEFRSADGTFWRHRREVPLSAEDDQLFYLIS